MTDKLYIKDMQTGKVFEYGSNHHHALRIDPDGRYISFEHLQNGDGSLYSGYRFCDKDGKLPKEHEAALKYGASAYFNIGGFGK